MGQNHLISNDFDFDCLENKNHPDDFDFHGNQKHDFDLQKWWDDSLHGGENLLARYQLDDKISSHNTDLTIGYQIGEMALVTASWLHSRTADDVSFSINDKVNDDEKINESGKIAKFKGSSNDFEVKAAFTGMKHVRPFISYTVAGDYKLKGEHKALNEFIGKDKNRVEAGITVRF